MATTTFAYDTYRGLIGSHTSPQAFAAAVADSYAARIGAQGRPYTIAELDMSKVNTIANATSALAGALVPYALASKTNRDMLLSLRNQAQKLDSSLPLYTITDDDEYVDLEDWATLIQSGVVTDTVVQSKAAALLSALNALRISSSLYKRHASGRREGIDINLENTHGIGIYYPQRGGSYTYTGGGLTFPADTLWDEFLAAALDSLPLDPYNPAPNPVAPLQHRVFLPIAQR